MKDRVPRSKDFSSLKCLHFLKSLLLMNGDDLMLAVRSSKSRELKTFTREIWLSLITQITATALQIQTWLKTNSFSKLVKRFSLTNSTKHNTIVISRRIKLGVHQLKRQAVQNVSGEIRLRGLKKKLSHQRSFKEFRNRLFSSSRRKILRSMGHFLERLVLR